MILDYYTIVKGSKRNKNYIESLGLIYEKNKEYKIHMNDLLEGFTYPISVQCDYCLKQISKPYWNFLKSRVTIEKDCCGNIDCMKKKRREVTEFKYGVSNINKLKSVRDKITKTNLERYGVENAFQFSEFQEKQKETVKQKYGVENVSQLDLVKQKKEQTLIENYGVKNPMNSSLLQEKAKNTMLEKYGHGNPLLIPENRVKMKKSLEQKVLNPNDVRTSYTQLYLKNLYGGFLNYQMKMYNLDIALCDQKICIEYDGSGHDLSVQYGVVSESDFKRKEIIRNEFIKSKGWKCIRIVAVKDRIPSDKKLAEMLLFSKEYFANGHSWITFDIENGIVYGAKLNEDYEFGELFSKYKIKIKLIEKGIITANNAI